MSIIIIKLVSRKSCLMRKGSTSGLHRTDSQRILFFALHLYIRKHFQKTVFHTRKVKQKPEITEFCFIYETRRPLLLCHGILHPNHEHRKQFDGTHVRMYTSFQALTTRKTPFGVSLMPFTYIYAQSGPAIEICYESAHLTPKTRKSMCRYAHRMWAKRKTDCRNSRSSILSQLSSIIIRACS